MAEGFYRASIRDYDNEIGVVRVAVALLTAANFDAQATLRGNFATALNNMTAADTVSSYSHGNDSVANITPASDPAAQRELKWLVQWHETGQVKPYRMTIPCADTSLLDPNDRSHAEIGDAGTVDAFVTAFEAFVVGPNGSAAIVDEITLVGRNV